MQLVQRHIIEMNHPHHQEIDFLCLLDTNLDNDTNCPVDKGFIVQPQYYNCNFLHKHLKYLSIHPASPPKLTIKVLLYLCNLLKFLLKIQTYKKKPCKFFSIFKLILHKDKKNRKKDILLYKAYRMSQLDMKAILIHLSQKNILGMAVVSSDKSYPHQITTIPKKHNFMVEVSYEKQVLKDGVKQNQMAVIDLRMDNLINLYSHQAGWIKVWEKKPTIKGLHGYCHQQPVKFKLLVTTYQTVIKQLQRIRNKLHRANRSLLIHADISGSLNIFIFRKLFSIALS